MLEIWKSLRGSPSMGFSLVCWRREIIMITLCVCVISNSVHLEHVGQTQANLRGKDLKYINFLQILWKLTAVQGRDKLLTFLSPTEGRAIVWINHWLTSETLHWISRSSYRFVDMCSVAHRRKSLNLDWLTPVWILVQLKKFWLERQCIVMQ